MPAQVPKGLGYVKSLPFILKAVEFMMLLSAIGTLGYFLHHASFSFNLKKGRWINSFDYFGKGNLDFGMYVIVIVWLLGIGFVALFITGLHEKVKCLHWPLTVAITMVIKGTFLFIAGCFLADTAREYDEPKNGNIFCEFIKSYEREAGCKHLICTTVLCFIATIVFGLDVFVHIRISGSARSPEQNSAANTEPI